MIQKEENRFLKISKSFPPRTREFNEKNHTIEKNDFWNLSCTSRDKDHYN
jgi:hypothetical protein